MEKQGYLTTPQGAEMPISKIKPVDLKRHDLVMDIVGDTKAMQELMREYKERTREKIHGFLDEVAKEYGTSMGGKGGNVTLSNYSQTFKVSVSVNQIMSFTEQLTIAEQLVNECLDVWTKDSDENLKAFIKTAFYRTKEGGVSVGKMLSLLRLDINDEKWRQAMRALKDSMITTDSKSYVRVHERANVDEKWEQIPLDVAKV